MSVPPGHQIWRVPLPPRRTVCDCVPGEIEYFDLEPAIFEYHAVSWGKSIVIYSKYRDDEDMLRSLAYWVQTDLAKVERLVNWCNERRAFQ